MKKYLLLILFLFAIGSVYSQGFQFYRTSPRIVYGDTSYYGVTKSLGLVKNTSTSNINVKFIRILNQIPTGWTTSLCTGINCYNSDLDTVPPRGAPPVILAPNQVDSLIIDFSGLTFGDGMVIIKAFINNDVNNFLTDTFRVHLGPVGIQNISTNVEDYKLEQNYPNPFNPITKINFSIYKNERVTLKVYDIMGREAAVLLNNDFLQRGKYSYSLDANEFNLASGMYFYTIQTENFVDTKKMILIK